MPIDNDTLLKLTKEPQIKHGVLKIGDKSYGVDSLAFEYSEVPVTKPTIRGGVYFSDRMMFKIKAKTSDLQMAKTLSKTMLGPNHEFEQIQILTGIEMYSNKKQLKIIANLINYVQKNTGLEMNLVVIDTELTN